MAHLVGGQGHRWQRTQRILIGVNSHRDHHFGIKTWPYPTAYSLQCWNASGQTTSSTGTQACPSADRLPKVVLSSQPPQNTPLDTALPTRGTSSTYQWGGISPPPNQEACTSLRTNLTHQGGRHQMQEEL